MKIAKIGVALLATCWLGLGVSDAALNAYLKLKGTTTHKFNPATNSDKIMVIAVSHEIVSPRDPQSGLPTGQRMHKPFVITKELDKSSPLLQKALVNNENIPEITLEMYEKLPDGNVKLTKLVTFTNCKIKQKRINPNAAPNSHEMETVAFTFQKITIQELNKVQGPNVWKG